jgi:hypothetical protein
MTEQFANERKTIKLESGQIQSLGVLFLSFRGVQPKPAKTAMKAENHSKEGPINTTVGKSRDFF